MAYTLLAVAALALALLGAAAQAQVTVDATCVTDYGLYTDFLSFWSVGGFTDQKAHWVWNTAFSQSPSDVPVYFFAVYDAPTATSAVVEYTCDNAGELSVNDVVISSSLADFRTAQKSTVSLKQGQNVIQIMAMNLGGPGLSLGGLIASMTVNLTVVLRTEVKSWQVSMKPRNLSRFDSTLSACPLAILPISAPTTALTKAPTKAPISAPTSSADSAQPTSPSNSAAEVKQGLSNVAIGSIAVVSASAVAAIVAGARSRYTAPARSRTGGSWIKDAKESNYSSSSGFSGASPTGSSQISPDFGVRTPNQHMVTNLATLSPQGLPSAKEYHFDEPRFQQVSVYVDGRPMSM
jgi:hypothetical protein